MKNTPGTMSIGASGGGDWALTGIVGLDNVLAGGLARDRLYLVEGTPGTGKTTLALQFLLEGRRLGERCMYVTLSETVDELRTSAATHGWSLDGLSIIELVPEAAVGSDQEQTLLHPAEFELGETTGRILERIDQERPARLVLDSLSELRLLAQTPLRYRRQVLALKRRFASHRCTVLLLDDQTAEPRDLQLHSIAQGVIKLEQSSSGYGGERRSLRVVKMRGVKFRGGYHDYIIETGGLVVYPRLVAAEHHNGFSPVPVGTGISELDALLGGGLVPGTSTLIMGPTGTGKTSTATRCILATLERGEPAAVFMFDEELGTFFARSAGLGMNLQPHLDSGRLQVRQIKPAELSPGEFVHYVRHAVEINGMRAILIDSLNGYMHAMPNEQYLILQMHELLSYLSQHGVATLLILGQHGLGRRCALGCRPQLSQRHDNLDAVFEPRRSAVGKTGSTRGPSSADINGTAAAHRAGEGAPADGQQRARPSGLRWARPTWSAFQCLTSSGAAEARHCRQCCWLLVSKGH